MTFATKLAGVFLVVGCAMTWSQDVQAQDKKDPECKPIEAIYQGRCIPKADCPAGVTEDLKSCKPIPACEAGTRWLKAKKKCVKKGEECRGTHTYVPSKYRCVLKGAECRDGRHWVPAQERCVVKGAECGEGRTWVPSKQRCVVKGAECQHEGMVWDAQLQRCKPKPPSLGR